jgi:voltage-gated potassium channel
VQNHTLVIGFGIKGRTAVKTLIGSGVKPSDIVVITASGSQVDDATKLGCVVVHGDAHQEDVLDQAVIRRASRIVIALDADDTTVLVTLAIRRMNPDVRIVASVRESVNVPALRQSGVDILISTAESAGQMLATSLLSPETGEVMSDLLDPVEGLQLNERRVRADEVGVRISALAESGELVLAVHRSGKMLRFDDPVAAVIEAGDSLVYARTV